MDRHFVKIYYADIAPLQDEALFSMYFNMIGKDRQERILRAGTLHGKIHLLSSGIILKKALETDFEVPDPGKLDFMYGDNGKPYIVGTPVFYNISHSADRVLCAVSDTEVGCDAEKITMAKMTVAKKFFTEEENALIDSASDDEKNRSFFDIWTKKESMAKLTGGGIKDISSAVTLPSCNISGKNVFCQTIEIEEGYSYSVAGFEEWDAEIKKIII